MCSPKTSHVNGKKRNAYLTKGRICKRQLLKRRQEGKMQEKDASAVDGTKSDWATEIATA
jgi:hypothetical protein